MAERDLDAMLARMAKTKVNRRELPGDQRPAGRRARSWPPVATRWLGAARRRRPAASAAPSTGARPPRRPATSRRSCSSTTGATTSRPTNIDAFKAEFGVDNFVYDIFANNEELIAKLQGGASGYDICCPTAEYVPGMVEEGFITKLDMSRIPNVGAHQPDLPEPVVGPEQRVPRPQGLRHDRHPLAQRPRVGGAGQRGRSSTTWSSRRGLGQDGLRRLDGRRHASSRSRCWATRSTPTIESRARGGAPDPARRGAAHPRPRLRHLRRQDGQRRGVPDPGLDRAARPGAGRPGHRRRRRLQRPVRGHAVLDGRLGDARRRAAPERRVRLARLHPAARRSRPRRPTSTCTRRRTTRPRSSSTRRSWPTRRSSRPTTSSPTSKAPRTPPATPSASTSGRSSSPPSAAEHHDHAPTG